MTDLPDAENQSDKAVVPESRKAVVALGYNIEKR